MFWSNLTGTDKPPNKRTMYLSQILDTNQTQAYVHEPFPPVLLENNWCTLHVVFWFSPM